MKAEVRAEPEDWTDEQVSIAGAYQSERVPIKLLLPKNAAKKTDSSHLVIAVPANVSYRLPSPAGLGPVCQGSRFAAHGAMRRLSGCWL